MAPAPDIVSLSAAQLEELLLELRPLLPGPTYQLVQSLLRTLQWLMAAIEEKKLSIARLQRMIFGNQTEKTDRLLASGSSSIDTSPSGLKPKRQGHGRKGAKDYPGAKRIPVPHPTHQPGGLAPNASRQTLSAQSAPDHSPGGSTHRQRRFELERLRCALRALFTARRPRSWRSQTRSSLGIMLSILRYGAGLPMYRMENGKPPLASLPASTQWQLIDRLPKPRLGFEALIDVAAKAPSPQR